MAALTVAGLQSLVNLSDVREEGRCVDGCDAVFEAFIDHPNWFCDGWGLVHGRVA